MSIGDIAELMRGLIQIILFISAPILLLAMSVGLVIAILQATTSIQEQTLTFVPKIIVVFLALMFLAPQLGTNLMDYTTVLFEQIPTMVG